MASTAQQDEVRTALEDLWFFVCLAYEAGLDDVANELYDRWQEVERRYNPSRGYIGNNGGHRR